MAFLYAIFAFYLLFCVVGLFLRSIPRILIFPVAPFLAAWELRKEKPVTAWTVLIIWSAVYILIAFEIIVYYAS